MESVLDSADPWRRAATLLILLPGAFDEPKDFIHEGFVKAVRERRIAADIQLLDAHTEYYMQQTIRDRLLADVVRPAREQGYSHIWLAGISLGGHGSLLFASAHGALLDGVFLMAPYLGRRDIPAQISAAGGLADWQPGTDAAADSSDLDLWRWLKGYAAAPAGSRPDLPPLYIGYGASDRFAPASTVLARALPGERVLTTHGAHEWAPWLRLWRAFLDRAPLPRLAADTPTDTAAR